MGYDYKQTHEKILNSAREQFREKGFRDASIRSICKNAGVTNGAFYSHFDSKEDLFSGIVQPCLDGLSKIYKDESVGFFEIKSAGDIIEAFRKTYASTDKIISFLCENREDFMLVLDSSAGTVYENFTEQITEAEARSMAEFLKKSKSYVKNMEKISNNIIKTGSSILINTIFDGVRQGLSSEEILKETALVSDYCIAGYKYLLGI